MKSRKKRDMALNAQGAHGSPLHNDVIRTVSIQGRKGFPEIKYVNLRATVRVKILHVEGLFGKDEPKFDIGENNVIFQMLFSYLHPKILVNTKE